MKYLSAYLLLALGGKDAPTAADITGLLTKLDVEVDAARVEQLVSAMEGKNLDEVLEEGEKKLIAVGGSGAAAAAPAGAGGAAAAAAPAKEEKPKEEAAEIDMSGGDLFGGGGKY